MLIWLQYVNERSDYFSLTSWQYFNYYITDKYYKSTEYRLMSFRTTYGIHLITYKVVLRLMTRSKIGCLTPTD